MSPVGWAEKGKGHQIQDEGADVADRDDLNFVGTGVTVADVGNKTRVNIPGGLAVLGDHDHTGDPGDGGNLPAYAPSVHDHNAAYYTEAEVDDLITAVAPSPTGSFVVEGGGVAWTGTGLQFRISAARYYIDSILYESLEQTVTLDAADPADDRIDVIALDNTGTVVKITGTPGANPSRPDVDPATQLHLTFVLVPAGATTPSGVASAIMYEENLGSPTEWDATSSGATINVNSSNNPRTGTKDVELTAAVNGNYLNLAAGASLNLANYAQLILFIRNKAAWASQKSLRLAFRSGGAVVGNFVSIDNSLFGFSDSLTGAYQQIIIPLTAFAVSVSQLINELRIEVRGSGGSLGLYIDDITLQGGVPQEAIGMTVEEADARYRKLVDDITSIDIIIDGGGAVITSGVKFALRFDFAGTIKAWAIGAPRESGSIIIDLWKDIHANFPPTNADSVTNGHEPTLTTAQVAEDTDLSDWLDVTVDAGDWIIGNIDSATDVTLVTLALKFLKA